MKMHSITFRDVDRNWLRGARHWLIFIFLITFVTGTECRNSSGIDESKNGIADQYGQLSINGQYLTDQDGDTVSLEGMSLFWSQWEGGKYYNYRCIKWLRDDWHCEIIRAAMGVEPNGYLEHPDREKKKVMRVIDACINLGLYVIVDWHSHSAEDNVPEVVKFYREIAQKYGDHPNIIYEIYNEPLDVSWSKVVKPYIEEVMAAIREYDPDNIIILGSPYWSQNVDEAAFDPINDNNVAYTLHFYASTHKQWLRDKAQVALDKGLPLWVTEYGTCESDGDGRIDYNEMKRWYEFMEKNKISWCNWSVVGKPETSAILKPDTGSRYGNWSTDQLTESGKYIRQKLISINP
jgi:endoglucanase